MKPSFYFAKEPLPEAARKEIDVVGIDIDFFFFRYILELQDKPTLLLSEFIKDELNGQ